jgi:hypothetical protein
VASTGSASGRNPQHIHFALLDWLARDDQIDSWTRASPDQGGGGIGPHALHPDGKRVALSAAEDTTNVIQDTVVLFTNFFEYLRTIAPGKK